MIEILRNWRYMLPVAALGVIAIVAVGLGGSPQHHAAATAGTTPERTATAATVLGTPAPGDVLLDARRRLDLAAIRDALEGYRFRFGAYPSTGEAYQGVCATAGEALCALQWIDAKLPSSDGHTGYRYRSDGTTYVLYSAITTRDGSSSCPDATPPGLSADEVFCLTSQEVSQ